MEQQTSADLLQAAQRPWLEDSMPLLLAGSLLYLDDGAGEAAAAGIGLPGLLGLGAANVCSLEAASREDMGFAALGGAVGEVPRIVVVLTQLLTDAHLEVVSLASLHPDVESFTILSAVPEIAHAMLEGTPLGPDAFSEYRAMLAEDMFAARGGGQAGAFPRVEVKYFPVNICPVDRSCFVLPAASATASLPRCGRRIAGFCGSPTQAHEREQEGEGAQGNLSLVAHALVALAAQMGYKLDAFAAGPVAKALGRDISRLPVPTSLRPGPGDLQPASLLLIDRSLDLATPCTRPQHLVAEVLEILQRRPPARRPPQSQAGQRLQLRPVDPRVDLGTPFPLSEILPQTCGVPLLSPGDLQAVQWLEALVARGRKDALLMLRKLLKEALRKEKATPNVRSKAGAVTPDELRGLAEPLVSSFGSLLRHSYALQWAEAAAKVLDQPELAKLRELAAAGQLAAAAVADDAGLLAGQLSSALSGGAPFEDAALLLLMGYSMASGSAAQQGGALPWDLEANLKDCLIDAVMQRPMEAPRGSWLGEDLRERLKQHAELKNAPCGVGGERGADGEEGSVEPVDGWGWDGDEDEDLPSGGMEEQMAEERRLRLEVRDAAEELFQSLHQVGAARQGLKELRHITNPREGIKPLLVQVVEDLVQRRDMEDFELMDSESLVGGLLSSGLGRLGFGAAKARPADHPLVILFVIGGISIDEVRKVRHTISSFPGADGAPKVIVGGTSLLTPEDVLVHFFA